MTTPSLGRLLISHITLRGPELSQLYNLIEQNPGVEYETITKLLTLSTSASDALGLDEAPLREAINFLIIAGLVEQSGATRRRSTFRVTPTLSNISLPLLLICHISAHPDLRQRAITLVYRQLVEADVLAITPQAIRETMERGPFGSLFAWTSEKVGLWGHLTASIGLTHQLEREGSIVLIPSNSLLLAAFHWVHAERETSSLDDYLRLIDKRFFACYTARGHIHQGLAQALTALHRIGSIELSHSADAAHSLVINQRRVSNVRLASEEAT